MKFTKKELNILNELALNDIRDYVLKGKYNNYYESLLNIQMKLHIEYNK